mmetsp:Transcript_6595/g.13335  ORF Transcript_6595/g.13335 Transcript_6595/m.13335 type:complete len:84 (+) Transcript_6595:1438-1689(+)
MVASARKIYVELKGNHREERKEFENGAAHPLDFRQKRKNVPRDLDFSKRQELKLEKPNCWDIVDEVSVVPSNRMESAPRRDCQ